MPCSKCNSDFNLLNWKIKCGECENTFCHKCLKKQEGVLYCEKCLVLLKRPPDRDKLMDLKPKDLQDYLKKHNISTHGLVEKPELVDLFCNKHIPVKPKCGTEKLSANFGCSLPNFRENSFSELWATLGSESLWNSSNSKRKTNTPNQSQIFMNGPQPPPRRRSTRNSPTTSTADSRIPCRNSAINSSLPVGVDHPSSTSSISNSSGASENITDEPLSESPAIPKCPKLIELKSEENINQLSAKQLKILLTLNRVDYKGCVEKKDLLEKVILLWKDSRKHRDEILDELDDVCKLCMDASLDCVLLECGHIATCLECGKRLAECPICRQYVSRVVRIFKA